MTKSREKGENEITREAKLRAAREGKTLCEVLAAMLKEAREQTDQERERKIIRAEKYAGCRNLRRRGKQ